VTLCLRLRLRPGLQPALALEEGDVRPDAQALPLVGEGRGGGPGRQEGRKSDNGMRGVASDVKGWERCCCQPREWQFPTRRYE
jgi:hypothetical protein